MPIEILLCLMMATVEVHEAKLSQNEQILVPEGCTEESPTPILEIKDQLLAVSRLFQAVHLQQVHS